MPCQERRAPDAPTRASSGSVDQPAPPPERSRRIYVYWAVGFALLAALALLCWLVVGPVISVNAAIEKAFTGTGNEAAALADLGSQQEAMRRLRVYYRMPYKVAPHKEEAVYLMGLCGEAALPDLQRAMQDVDSYVRRAAVTGLRGTGEAGVSSLIDALGDRDFQVRLSAVESLRALGATALPSVPALKRFVHDGKTQAGARQTRFDHDVRLANAAARALGEMGPGAREAIPELEWAVQDQWPGVCQTAAAALTKIRAGEATPPPGSQAPAP